MRDTPEITARVVHPSDLTAGDVTAWLDMQHADPAQASPFLSPGFATVIGTVRPGARVLCLSDAEGPLLFWPFERHRMAVGRPIGFGMCDCQGPVLRPGLDGGTVTAAELLRLGGLRLWEFDHLACGRDVFGAGELRRAASPVMVPGEAGTSSELRRTARRKTRRLEETHGPLRLVFTDPDQDGSTLDTLLHWKSRQLVHAGARDPFGKPGFTDLVRRLAAARGAGCDGNLSVLYAGERRASMLLSLRSEDVLATFIPTYDPELARYSPGTLLHLRLAAEAAEHGVRLIDMGKGTETYKRELATGELEVAEGRVTTGTPLGTLLRLRGDGVRAARRTVLGNTRLRRAATRVLSAYDRARGVQPVTGRQQA